MFLLSAVKPRKPSNEGCSKGCRSYLSGGGGEGEAEYA